MCDICDMVVFRVTWDADDAAAPEGKAARQGWTIAWSPFDSFCSVFVQFAGLCVHPCPAI